MTSEIRVQRPLVLASIMAALFMIAVEATIVSTAMPQIAGQLGDLHLYSWAFSAFLLTQTATTVAFGKLADLYGRRPVLLWGIAVFLVGSWLCGLAWSMPWLIAFRLVQGIGAGAIQPVCMTIVGDLYPAQERAKVQGYLASVWGVSSVMGPLAGALIIQHLSWRWVFWINLPVGAVAVVGLILTLHEEFAVNERPVDYVGAALFTLAVALLMVALTEAGVSSSVVPLGAAGLCAICVLLFALQERRAVDPIMNFRMWSGRAVATANAATLLSGMAIIGLTTFLPMYVQGVLNRSALVAGFTLTVMVLGWPIGATLAARNFGRFGLRATLLFGGALLPVGALVFALLREGMSPLVAGTGSLVMGFGMGFLTTSAIVIVQDSVGRDERGAATASNIFSRNLGSTLGATVLGAVLNISLARGSGATGSFDEVRQLLGGDGGTIGDVAARAALGHSLHLTFLTVLAVAVMTFLLALTVPRIVLGQPTRPVVAAD